MDIRKRIFSLPQLGKKAEMVCIPTTSGTGAEVTPFAVITDDENGNIKYPLADYAFTPNMAIIDPDFAMTMPRGVAVAGGIDAVVHATEAYVSIMASPYTDGLALEALKKLFTHLVDAVNTKDEYAIEQIHYAATIAGMAFANAFLGINHSLAHKMGTKFNLPHGIANAFVFNQVIRFNATDNPTKQAGFAQYKYPFAKKRYAEIADALGLGGKTEDEKVNNFIKANEKLKADLGIPSSIKAWGKVTEKDFMNALDELSELAFDDQCTGANPRYPLIKELKEIYIKAWNGETDFDI